MNYLRFFYQPLGLLIARAWITVFGTLRQKEWYGVLKRPDYAYGLFRAADIAKFFGKRKVTVCEFGVASGSGLLNMIALADRVSIETKVDFRIVGFDTGEGLPEVKGYKDHAEMWSAGDFPMQNQDDLVRAIGDRAEIMFGDIKDTVHQFVGTLDPDAPLGFIAVDVDIYTATKNALKCLLGNPELYNPAISIYFDDIGFFFANRWCGELAAIYEFNAENDLRKIDKDRSLPKLRPVHNAAWYQRMYVCHVLDHEARNNPLHRNGLTMEEYQNFIKSRSLF